MYLLTNEQPRRLVVYDTTIVAFVTTYSIVSSDMLCKTYHCPIDIRDLHMTACSRNVRPSVACASVIPLLLAVQLLAGCQASKESEPPAASSQPIPSPTEIDVERPIETPTPSHSDVVPDAIVVGAGISGLSAALELARGGAAVTVIDMSSVFGGHAVMSQGSLSIVGSPVQEAAGFYHTRP